VSNNPIMVVYCGPMFGGKTTRLLGDLERFTLQHKRCAVFKPSIDVRYGSDEVVSHAGWRADALMVKSGPDVLSLLTEMDQMPDVVFVDEAFMLPGIADVVIWLYRSGISVVVSTLDMSYAGKPFPEVARLLPWATRIEKCPAVCTECGRDAFYTYRKQVAAADEEIQVGGAELYDPRCFRHIPFIADQLPDMNRYT